MNIAEKLKDAPKGMKLYSPMFGKVTLKEVGNIEKDAPIVVTVCKDLDVRFTKEGYYYTCYEGSECVLFPSYELRDWSKFHIHKPGTFLATKNDGSAFILKGYDEKGYPVAFAGIDSMRSLTVKPGSTNKWTTDDYRLAFPTEIALLIEKLRENGYEWNEETLELKIKKVKEEPNTKRKMEELKEAATPLIKYLCENYHPHVTAIVTPTSAEVLESIGCVRNIVSVTLKTS